MPSEVLGLELQRQGVLLKFYDPADRPITSREQDIDRELEIKDRLRESKVALRESELGRLRADVEVERLRREIEDLRRRLPEGDE